jgi:hypothetical protein
MLLLLPYFADLFNSLKNIIPELSDSELQRILLEKPHTLTLALSPQGRGDLRIAPPLRGGDKGEGV